MSIQNNKINPIDLYIKDALHKGVDSENKGYQSLAVLILFFIFIFTIFRVICKLTK